MTTPSMRVVALAGARAGRYELLEELERDGVTAVWLARAARAGSPPACVVVLDHRVGMQLELRSEFLREARAAQAARHERLLPIEDVGPFGPAAYLCMPWLDAVPFDELLAESTRRSTALPASVVLRIALDALEPLAALHAATPPPSSETGTHHPALHGDLTPHSLWLTEQGRCYLASSCVGSAVASLASDDIAVRLAFKAPEQLQPGGSRPDARADQFAFGALLWSALAGHRLFVGADSVALVRAVLSAPVPSLADVGVAVSSGVSNVIARALSRDPDARYRDLHELSLALRASSADVIADPAAVADVVSDLGTRRFIAQRKRIRALFGGELAGEDLPVPSLTGGPTTLQSPLPLPNGERGRERAVAPVETVSARGSDSKKAAARVPGPGFAEHDSLVDSADFVSSSRLASAPISSGDIAVREREEAAVDSKDFIEPAVESQDLVERSVDSGDVVLMASSQPQPTLPSGKKPEIEVIDTPVGGTPIPKTPVGGQPIADIELAAEPRSSSRMQSARSHSAASQRWPLSEEERRARELPTLPPSRQRQRQTTSRAAKRSGSSWIGWFIAALMLAVVVAFFVRKRSLDAETTAEPTATEEPQPPPPIERPVAAPPPEPVPEPPPPPPVVEAPPPAPSPSPARPEPAAAPAPKPTAKPAPKPVPVEKTAKPPPTEAAPAPAPKPKAAPKPKPADDRMLEGI